MVSTCTCSKLCLRIEVHKNSSFTEEHEIKDTICGLTKHQKIRLCTLVLNAETFHEEVTFLPDENNVDTYCYRGVIYQSSQCNNSNITENDWMISCKAVRRSSDKPVIYYVSAGLKSYEQVVFCGEHGTKNITLVGGVGCRINVLKKVNFPQPLADAKHQTRSDIKTENNCSTEIPSDGPVSHGS